MTPLAYQQEIERKCGWEEKRTEADNFLADLRGDAKATGSRILAGIAEEVATAEAEYVCTVELFYSTEERAQTALLAWKNLKDAPK